MGQNVIELGLTVDEYSMLNVVGRFRMADHNTWDRIHCRVSFTETPRGVLFTETPRGVLFAETPRGVLFTETPRDVLFTETPRGVLFTETHCTY